MEFVILGDYLSKSFLIEMLQNEKLKVTGRFNEQ